MARAKQSTTPAQPANSKTAAKPDAPSHPQYQPLEFERLALASPKIQALLGRAAMKKVVYVPGKLVNLVM